MGLVFIFIFSGLSSKVGGFNFIFAGCFLVVVVVPAIVAVVIVFVLFSTVVVSFLLMSLAANLFSISKMSEGVGTDFFNNV